MRNGRATREEEFEEDFTMDEVDNVLKCNENGK